MKEKRFILSRYRGAEDVERDYHPEGHQASKHYSCRTTFAIPKCASLACGYVRLIIFKKQKAQGAPRLIVQLQPRS